MVGTEVVYGQCNAARRAKRYKTPKDSIDASAAAAVFMMHQLSAAPFVSAILLPYTLETNTVPSKAASWCRGSGYAA